MRRSLKEVKSRWFASLANSMPVCVILQRQEGQRGARMQQFLQLLLPLTHCVRVCVRAFVCVDICLKMFNMSCQLLPTRHILKDVAKC